jgi:hypothetical protein
MSSDYQALSRAAEKQQRLQTKLELAVRDALDTEDWVALRQKVTPLLAELEHLDREAMRS